MPVASVILLSANITDHWSVNEVEADVNDVDLDSLSENKNTKTSNVWLCYQNTPNCIQNKKALACMQFLLTRWLETIHETASRTIDQHRTTSYKCRLSTVN